MQVGQEKGGLQRMGNIWLAGLAGLTLMASGGVLVGLPYQFSLVWGQVARYSLKQSFGFFGYSYPICFILIPMIISWEPQAQIGPARGLAHCTPF